MTKRLIIIPADDAQEIRVREAEKAPRLQELQDICDGYIEAVPHWVEHEGMRCVVYCNEEGKMRDLPLNRRATLLWYAALGTPVDDVLCGDIAIVASLPRAKKEKANGER
jgi:hypothetical protein